MLPYYAYHALNKFNELEEVEPKFHEIYGADVLFNTSTSTYNGIPSFNCLDARGDAYSNPFNSSYLYSPDKIEEYVTNPQPINESGVNLYNVEPSTLHYLWLNQSDPEQILKNAIGADFIYGSNRDGVKLADNYKQKLQTLNALRHSSRFIPATVNTKTHTRVKTWDSSGVLTGDSGWVIEEQSDSYVSNHVAYHQIDQSGYNDDAVLRRSYETYITFDVDFSGISLLNPNLLDSYKFYMSKFGRQYNVNTYEYDKEILTITDGASYEFRAEEPQLMEIPGRTNINYYGSYRYSTSLKEMTMEDLADHYQVPY